MMITTKSTPTITVSVLAGLLFFTLLSSFSVRTKLGFAFFYFAFTNNFNNISDFCFEFFFEEHTYIRRLLASRIIHTGQHGF